MGLNRIPVVSRMLYGDRRLAVLVVDSDPEIQSMMSQLVPPDLYVTHELTDSVEVLERLRWFDVAMVLIDVSILKTDKHLRDALAFRVRLGMNVIVTSTSEDPADEMVARSLGCVLYAPKPCGYWMLHQAVTELLCKSGAPSKGI